MRQRDMWRHLVGLFKHVDCGYLWLMWESSLWNVWICEVILGKLSINKKSKSWDIVQLLFVPMYNSSPLSFNHCYVIELRLTVTIHTITPYSYFNIEL